MSFKKFYPVIGLVFLLTGCNLIHFPSFPFSQTSSSDSQADSQVSSESLTSQGTTTSSGAKTSSSTNTSSGKTTSSATTTSSGKTSSSSTTISSSNTTSSSGTTSTSTKTSSEGNTSTNTSTTSQDTGEGTYYTTITDGMSGSTLLNALKSIITVGASQSYDWSRYEAADEDPNNSNNVLLIYARTSMSKSLHVSGSTGWNREHTFPQSKLDGGDKSKSDNHIIYASDCKVNGARGNIKMGVVDSGTIVKDCYNKDTSCKKTSSLFDPHSQARGIVARTTMYAAAMYGYDPEDNFESIETMLSWHLEYYVDSFDIKRNNIVYGNQHNRNPFVDHPEYACRIWGNTSSRTKQLCGIN